MKKNWSCGLQSNKYGIYLLQNQTVFVWISHENCSNSGYYGGETTWYPICWERHDAPDWIINIYGRGRQTMAHGPHLACWPI